jgi:DNA-nicking Smr family endonuclease
LQEINKNRRIAGQLLHLRDKLEQEASNALNDADSAVFVKNAAECKDNAVAHNQMAAELIKKLNEKTHDDTSKITNATCINYLSNNFFSITDTLDLHGMQVWEAMSCLETFLDTHVFKLRAIKKPFRMLSIITGWGRHRKDGNSQIKSKAIELFKSRLLM